MKLNESLDDLMTEPLGKASQQAKRKGLVYVGFGRYLDPKSRQVTHVNNNDQLIPFNQIIQTNTFQQQGQDDIGLVGQALRPETDELHSILTQHYSKTKYDSRELEALKHYTDLGHIDINHRLSQIPVDTPAHQIERQFPEDNLPDIIGSLDSALKKSRAPMDFTTYAKLHDDTDLSVLKPGNSFKLRSYRNSSIHLPTVVGSTPPKLTSPEGRPMMALLKLNIRKNSRGLYASDYSTTPDDREFLIPRGAEIRITDKPKVLIGSDGTTGIPNLQMHYYNAEVKG